MAYFNGTSANETYVGGSGDDTLLGNGGNDSLSGGNGRDRIEGGADVDILRGQGGDDLLDGGDDGDVLHGDAGSDTLIGGAGYDNLLGGADDDRLEGGSEDDYLRGEAGNDEVLGGAGADTIIASLGDDLYNGGAGAGADFLTFGNLTGPITIELARTDRQDTGAGLDRIIGIEILEATSDDDVLIGSDRAETLVGSTGDDFVDAGAGDDQINYRNQFNQAFNYDTVLGGAGNDICYFNKSSIQFDGGEGHDTFSLFPAGESGVFDLSLHINLVSGRQIELTSVEELIGGVQEDTLLGTAAADTLSGGNSDDRLEGREGADVLKGDGGADTLLGLEGDDTLAGGEGDDLYIGGAGFDVVDFRNAITAIYLNLGTTLPQATREGSDQFAAVEGFFGSAFDDAVTGSDNGDRLIGALGNDTLHASGGADTLLGGKGNDQLQGGAGRDLLTGHAGADRFRFTAVGDSPALMSDRITDLQAVDVIDVSGIDANALAFGNQAFTLVETRTGAGQAVLSYNAGADRTSLSLYTDGGRTPDAVIYMDGDHRDHDNFVW